MQKENLYSRQIGTYGSEMMSKISELSVFLSGLRGLGVETAKNLILSGVINLTIHDNNLVHQIDLSSNYCFEELDIHLKTRADASFPKIKSLNPSMNLQIFKGDILEIDLSKYNVVVLTESIGDTIEKISEKCRKYRGHKVAFISAECWGPACYAFVDFGKGFKIFDSLGVNYEDVYIKSISQSDPGVVTTYEPHKLAYENSIVFNEIQGMTELNKSEPITIINIPSPTEFEIPSTLEFTPYIKDGIFRVIKVPKKIDYASLSKCLQNPKLNNNMPIRDFSAFDRKQQTNLAVLSILNFSKRYKKLPSLHKDLDSLLCLKEARRCNKKHSIAVKIDEDYIKKVSLFAETQISAISSVWGGIIAQEVLKFTGKYSSFFQWGFMDFSEIFVSSTHDCENSRYADLVSVIGISNFENLTKKKVFIVGAGALGCELIKHMAMMGIGKHFPVTVTDNDSIELSNLSRQFLFRSDNIGQSKSRAAVKAAECINGEAKMIALTEKVCKENEHQFTDEFWDGVDLVVLAVDNLEARNYVDSKCIWHKKILLESGTLGMQASSQVILPNQTLTYADTPQSVTKEIPMCTLKSFPYLITHCIEWARDFFEELFSLSITSLKSFSSNPITFCKEIQSLPNTNTQYEKLLQLNKVKFLCSLTEKSDLIKGAYELYLSYFRDNILELLHHNPPDTKNQDGTPFWSGTKRIPKPASLNPNDSNCVNFLFSLCSILQRVTNLNYGITVECISQFLSGYEAYEFERKFYGNEERINEYLKSEMRVLESCEPCLMSLKPESFEKDDDLNYHVEFIMHASNIRAESYHLETTDRHNAKMIAGRIIPAIASTTSVISGIVAVEIIKTAIFTDMKKFRNVNLNLALPNVKLMGPSAAKKLKLSHGDEEEEEQESVYTSWDFLELRGPMSLTDFVDYFPKNFGVTLTSACIDGIMIYMNGNDKAFERLREKKLEDLYTNNSKKQIPDWRNAVEINANGYKVGTKETSVLPKIKYFFR